MGLYKLINGYFNDRRIKKYEDIIKKINYYYDLYKPGESTYSKVEFIKNNLNILDDEIREDINYYLFMIYSENNREIINEIGPQIRENVSKGLSRRDALKKVLKEENINVSSIDVLGKFNNNYDKNTYSYKYLLKIEETILGKIISNETKRLKNRVKNYIDGGINSNKALKIVLPEAYALVKAAIYYKIGIKIYDVQLMGAIAMNEGNILEMATGEGKTLTAIFPAYLNALTGKEVDIFTANDYLAERDASNNRKIFNLLGMSVGCVKVDDQDIEEKQKAYKCDIVYGSSTAFAFDYLFDSQQDDIHKMVLRNEKPGFVIVDEADLVMINNALTPFILSDFTKELSEVDKKQNSEVINYLNNAYKYVQKLKNNTYKATTKNDFKCLTGYNKNKTEIANKIYNLIVGNDDYVLTHLGEMKLFNMYFEDEINKLVKKLSSFIINSNYFLKGKDYVVDKDNDLHLTVKGLEIACKNIKEFNDLFLEWLTDEKHQVIKKYVDNAIRAEFLLIEGKDYTVKYNENTNRFEVKVLQDGREVPNSKFTDGIHQAIELKEGLNVIVDEGEKLLGNDLSNISLRALLSRYEKISGMTGTADKDAFYNIYNLDTFTVPKNKEYEYARGRINKRPYRRVDLPAKLFKESYQKAVSIAKDIEESNRIGRPVLVITDNEMEAKSIANLLKLFRPNIKFNLLTSSKNLKEEAEIISKAGLKGAVTIATEMAGRGTDIKLGGEKGEGKDELIRLGGIKYIQTKPFRTTRNDRQGRGRVARCGDPGEAILYASIDDLKQIGVDKDDIKELNNYFVNDYLSDDKVNGILSDIITKTQYENEFIDDLRIAETGTIDFATSAVGMMIKRKRKELLSTDDVSVIVNDMTEEVVYNEIKNSLLSKNKKDVYTNKKLNKIKIDYNFLCSNLNSIFSLEFNVDEILTFCNDLDDLKAFIYDRINKKQDELLSFDKNIRKKVIEGIDDTYLKFIDCIDTIQLQEFNYKLARNDNYNPAIEVSKIYNECITNGWKKTLSKVFRQSLKNNNNYSDSYVFDRVEVSELPPIDGLKIKK